jgi:hypothetical protein
MVDKQVAYGQVLCKDVHGKSNQGGLRTNRKKPRFGRILRKDVHGKSNQSGLRTNRKETQGWEVFPQGRSTIEKGYLYIDQGHKNQVWKLERSMQLPAAWLSSYRSGRVYCYGCRELKRRDEKERRAGEGEIRRASCGENR